MERIAVVGAGLIGRAWAMVFARAGCSVTLWDKLPGVADAAMDADPRPPRRPPRGRAGGRGARCDRRAHHAGGDAGGVPGRRRPCAGEGAGAARREARAVRRARPAQPDGRRAGVLDQRHPGQRLHRERCRAAAAAWSRIRSTRPTWCRSWNWWARPGPVPTVVARTRALMDRVGQVPVVAMKETRGFVLNRMQAALVAEAFRLVRDGVMSVEDVDACVQRRARPALELHGPLRDHRPERARRRVGLRGALRAADGRHHRRADAL